MVKRCFNSACQEEFKLLNAGDLYACERRSADTEFFWLCCGCASRFDIFLDAAGRVTLEPRRETYRFRPPYLDGRLRLISRSVKPAPRPNTLPFGERPAAFFTFGPGLASFRSCRCGGTARQLA
jgi:hypothetical protein